MGGRDRREGRREGESLSFWELQFTHLSLLSPAVNRSLAAVQEQLSSSVQQRLTATNTALREGITQITQSKVSLGQWWLGGKDSCFLLTCTCACNVAQWPPLLVCLHICN